MHGESTCVLFVSRDNAGRSLLAEACLRHLGGIKFKAYSCGMPLLCDGEPKDCTVTALHTIGIPTERLECKDWTKFTRSGSRRMDFVIALDAETVQSHPIWPGQPHTAVWAFPPLVPNKNTSTEVDLATMHTLHSLRRRIELLVSLCNKARNRTDMRNDVRELAHI